ncbi:MAG: creatininase family protein [Chloroflexi bacterium]|nr:MAG: creatininase family protein [Chloroflexota bacterium]
MPDIIIISDLIPDVPGSLETAWLLEHSRGFPGIHGKTERPVLSFLKERTMQWENLTSADFAKAVKETGVCVITFGVVEKHSEHLPLGTDFLNGQKLACLAAEIEPAVVFPPFYFGQIYEAKCFPGTIALKPTLLVEVITGVLDEIGRNGFKKIILVNAHGGNAHLLPFLAQASLYEQKPYTLYLYQGREEEEFAQQWQSIVETEVHGHACECETSVSLANHA